MSVQSYLFRGYRKRPRSFEHGTSSGEMGGRGKVPVRSTNGHIVGVVK